MCGNSANPTLTELIDAGGRRCDVDTIDDDMDESKAMEARDADIGDTHAPVVIVLDHMELDTERAAGGGDTLEGW
jgi:hypothetical protein